MKRRKHLRLLAQVDAFAAVRPMSTEVGKTRVGRIKNISSGGLAFEYVNDEEGDLSDEEWDKEPSQVDIFISSEHRFHLSNVPCSVVYRIPEPRHAEHRVFLSRFGTRQCGIHFEQLTEDKMKQLSLFLETHTSGAAPKADEEQAAARSLSG